ncbi:EH domain-containing protein 1 [Thelohanellus kitauei]|uniref:EH domain-containing protein 1 n=1 Tax=Thelohanellus kitauei TaxID=669202 RepID=A0A0C2N5K3_THEKT|nr:EH domain-containing protein 1 [Thelohanellus kitauei]
MSVGEIMCKLYHDKLLPFEKYSRYHELVSPKLEDADFTSAPMIMFVGQYSTGKTTIIKYLLSEEYPDLRIGPEPTTDRFVAVMHGQVNKTVPGHVAASDPQKPFGVLSKFGNGFLNRFSVAELNNELLKNVTIIDTPGILSGSKQTELRGYPFVEVMKTIGERCERIILLFDAHKLDISEEFREAIEALQNHENKMRIALNKADKVSDQELMRIYGALMWSLGKIIHTPEVTKVYIGSFWDEPYQNPSFQKLFEAEEVKFMKDLASVNRDCALRRLNDLISRARSVIIVAYLLDDIARRLPTFYKESKKPQICQDLPKIYEQLSVTKGLPIKDFPEVTSFSEKLKYLDFGDLPKLKKAMIDNVTSLISVDLPKLIEKMSREEKEILEPHTLKGGIFSAMDETKNVNALNPFEAKADIKMKLGAGSNSWVVDECRSVSDEVFLFKSHSIRLHFHLKLTKLLTIIQNLPSVSA